MNFEAASLGRPLLSCSRADFRLSQAQSVSFKEVAETQDLFESEVCCAALPGVAGEVELSPADRDHEQPFASEL